MNENVDYVAKRPSKSTKFLWWCAGADEKILQYCSYSDHVKYLGIGGVVLATSFMAFLSMGFALHIIFDGKWYLTIPIAFIWSLIVFNLDRFIVSSTGKGDGESSISWTELANAAPRLLMAILLGLTISAPLEVFIFEKEIEREWKDTKFKLSQSRINEIKIAKFSTGEVRKVREKLKQDSLNLVKYNADKNLKEKMIQDLLTGANGQSKCTRGKNCATHRELYIQSELANKLRDSTAKVVENVIKELKIKDSIVMLDIEKESKLVLEEEAGFLDKIIMLENLSAHKKEIPEIDQITKQPIKNKDGEFKMVEIAGSAFWAVWMVRLLFMIIEIAPVILKLMLIKSPYDYMTENVNQILEAKQGISMNHMTDEEGKLTKYKENFNPKRIIAIVEHQNAKEEENAKEAITRFADKEKQEIEKNPDAFITPNDSNS
jgi:hypothetical protein